MTVFYFDTSVLVKLYIKETGSLWVDHTVNDANPSGTRKNLIIVSKLGIPETTAAFARRQRMGQVTAEQQETLVKTFLKDHQQKFRTATITDAIISSAVKLTQRFSLRAYDAVHLATALNFNQALLDDLANPLTFATADKTLLAAAGQLALTVCDPSDYETQP